ncbi:endocuticle structural glycoprotein SgAbd-2-like [Agrilus planipennis]|uniref:Endocuticle structural glycoprotein SgAbd-2-like n=1 Tax=Agrilus planipennis TaxID=224129 RepID=A0A1W4XQ81_AGRPL|nr:endocuticle structural glycoprotein SgAbd-2-like [Agrilus planipennis]
MMALKMNLIIFSSILVMAFGASLDNVFSSNFLPFSGFPAFRTNQFQNNVPILRYSNDNNEDGNYRYAYETGNGISVQETGHFSPSVPEGGAIVANGGFAFTGTDGQTYSISYTADENGFRPVGAHIPTPPPIPEAIARSLAGIARSSYTPDNGQYQYQPYFGGYRNY